MPDSTQKSSPQPYPPGGDPSSRDDESLLIAAKKALVELGSTLESQSADAPPQMLGPYRVVSVLGRGGMGTVYEAEQQFPKRPVALKVVRGGRFVDEHYLRLFQREAQTLARLRHPGVASIYEAGCTDDGQHYFAMELVRGTTLDEFARTRNLNTRERLRLFCDICEAINYAHQRGVIHRDLKPSNILVDPNGHAKVLDFGLARITDIDIAVTSVVSAVGQIQGTVAYMSPEQARGNPDEIDLRSDVYSLGVMLYELLTERKPYAVDQSVLHEAVRTICEVAPARMSAVNRTLRGDLETIVLKALAKEPARRYHSAAALKEDIERYLTKQPILARPPSTFYQFRKLASRHKAGCAFVLTLFAVVIGFSIWNRVLFHAEQRQHRLTLQAEHRARHEAETAKYVSNYLVGLFSSSDPDSGSKGDLTAREILQAGAQQIEHDLDGEPAIQARLMNIMGMAYRNLGLYESATPLFEQAEAVRRRHFGEDSPEVAESLFYLGWLARLKGSYAEADRLVSRALAMRRKLFGDRDRKVAEPLAVIASIRRDRGDFAAAERHIRESLAIQRALPSGRQNDLDIAFALETLSEILEEEGDYAEAEATARECLAIRQRHYGDDHHYVASTRQALATALRGQGRYKEAELNARDALETYRRAMGADHQYTASAATLFGGLLRDRRAFDEADRVLRDADATMRRRFAETRPDHPYIALASHRLAWNLLDRRVYEEAERLFVEALSIYRKRFGSSHPNVVGPLLGLGRTLHAQGRFDRALDRLHEAQVVADALPSGHWMAGSAASAVGDALVALERYPEAEAQLVKGQRAMAAVRGESDRYVREATQRIVSLYERWNKPEKAAEYRAVLNGGTHDGKSGTPARD